MPVTKITTQSLANASVTTPKLADSIYINNLSTSNAIVNGNLNVIGTLSATMLEALSARITVLDIKQYELSGFNVTGDVTIQGAVSATNNITAPNLIYNGGNTNTAPLSVGTKDNYNLTLETAGLSRMTILSGGNVGIGTGTPTAKLTVVGNISATGGLSLLSECSITDNAGRAAWNSQGTPIFRGHPSFGLGLGNNGLNWGANVAAFDLTLRREAPYVLALGGGTIGGLNPQAFNIYNTYTSATSAERASLKWVDNTFVIGTETLPTSASNRSLAFQTASAVRMTILSGGNVGIGTATPNEKLTVVGNVSATGSATVGNIYTSGLSATTSFSPPKYTTTQRDALTAVDDGNVLYNTTQTNLNTYNSTLSAWGSVISSDDSSVQKIQKLTQAQYDALSSGPIATTMYIITDANTLGSVTSNIVNTTTDYVLGTNDCTLNITANNVGITLPSCLDIVGRHYYVKNSGTGIATLSAAAGEYIDGSSTVSLTSRYQSLHIQSAGIGWVIL